MEAEERTLKNWWEEKDAKSSVLGRLVGFPLFEGREWGTPFLITARRHAVEHYGPAVRVYVAAPPAHELYHVLMG